MKNQLFIVLLFILIFSITPASAFTIDNVYINIDNTGAAEVHFHYSLSWWEKIYYQLLASLSGGEKQFIESTFSDALEKDVTVNNLNTKSNEVELFVSYYIYDREYFQDGYWISYEGIIPKNSFSIKDVTLVFPDGYIKTDNGKIPAGIHFVNNNLATYYYHSQYYQNIYEKSYGIYDPENYRIGKIIVISGEFINGLKINQLILKEGLKSFTFVGLPQQVQMIIQSIESIKAIIEGKPYENLNSGLIEKVADDTYLNTLMSPQSKWSETNKKISDNMKQMSVLKSQEIILINKLSSESENKEFNKNLGLLITNLNDQKNILISLSDLSL